MEQTIELGDLIRPLDSADERWMPRGSLAGEAITAAVYARCRPDQRPTRCEPE